MNIAETIYDRWLELRAAGRLDDVLPCARAYRHVSKDGEVYGYDTCEHQIHRRVSIPGSGPTGGNGVAGLVETYFSVRHSNGWGHNLHVHVVEIKNEMLQVSHLAQLFRCVAGVRVGLCQNGLRINSQAQRWMHRNLYVHGALLGPAASGDVLIAEAMIDKLYDHMTNGLCQPLIRVGCVTAHPKKGVTVKRIEPDSNYSAEPWSRDDAERARLKQTIDSLLGSSPMWLEWSAARKDEEQIDRKRESLEPDNSDAELKVRRDAILRLLVRLGLTPTANDRARIEACTDTAALDRWVDDVLGAKVAAVGLS